MKPTSRKAKAVSRKKSASINMDEILNRLSQEITMPDYEASRSITYEEVVDLLIAFREELALVQEALFYVGSIPQYDEFSYMHRTAADDEDPLLTVAQVCQVLGVTDRTIRNYMSKGILKSCVSPTGEVRFRLSEVKAFYC